MSRMAQLRVKRDELRTALQGVAVALGLVDVGPAFGDSRSSRRLPKPLQ